MTDNTAPPKTCKLCGAIYPATPDFWNRKRDAADGLRSMCKQCQRATYKRYYRAHSEKILARHSEYRQIHRTKMRALKRRWALANPDRIHATRRAHYRKHRAKILAYKAAWAKANPARIRSYLRRYRDKYRIVLRCRARQYYRNNIDKGRELSRARANRRRAHTRNGGGNIYIEDIRQIFIAQRRQCFYCACDISAKYHIEHKTPLSRGGSNDISNIVLACPSCNLKKGRMTAEEFLANHNPAEIRPKILPLHRALHLRP